MSNDKDSAVLAPCPFCGSKAFMWPDFGNGVQINCNKPCAVSPTVGMRTEAQAISAWNLRQQAQPTLVDALKDCSAGLAYVRQHYGELSGVGFARALNKAETAIAALEDKHD